LRFIAPLVLATALLGAAPASAGFAPKLYTGQPRLGVQTSSRSATGSCSASVALLTDLMLKCDSDGTARVKYLFALPKKAGSVTAQVSFNPLVPHRGAVVSMKRVSGTQFRVTVTQDSPGRADIESVTIEYYVG